MKKIKLKLMLIASCTLLTVVGCKKEGTPGPAGTDGRDGNANVKSVTLTVNSQSNWAWNSSTKWREAYWTGISILDQSATTSGAVMLYQHDGSGGYFALPATITFGGTTENDWFAYTQGSLSVIIQNTNGTDPISQIAIPTNYKLVVIPSAVRLSNPDVDLLNYNEVKEVYGLK